ncbi:DUF885 domain-containing protein [Amycolatopsis taiwanensis]|uniref:DUF885 domain-containing protein n=1 Tax=Amycolatopsis taiwanensis TaxID=342230 RepID=UPI0004B81BF7|nr:DUF885 domain-containing protein [Amycolatopsis taiwanensis]
MGGQRGRVTGPVSDVDSLAGELVELVFTANPIARTLLGVPGAHDRLPDLSAENEQRLRSRYLDLAARAEGADGDAVTRAVVIQQARAGADRIDAAELEFQVSSTFSAPALSILDALGKVTLDDEEKIAGHLARLAAIPSYLDTVRERQRSAISRGLVPADFLVDVGIAHIERYLANPATDPLRLRSDDREEALLVERVRPAYRRYRDFLADEVRPHATDRPGMCWQPGGEERYARLVRVHTTTEATAQELHETGLAVISSLAEEYRELGARVFGTTELAEIFRRLRTDPELRWTSGEELLDAARSAVARAEAAAPAWFRRLPDHSCAVKAIPDLEAEGQTLGYYVRPTFSGSRGGAFYANTFRAQDRFRHMSEALAFHEAVPGHHFQLAGMMKLDLPLLRRICRVTACSEGWALYAERLADEMGLYSSDLSRFGMLTQDSMRAGRLVVDTGMHALGWSRQQAVNFLTEHTPMAPLEIESEIDRYAGWPAQALSYMVGRLEIERIRGEAERALGARFDVREFHDAVLRQAVVPLPVLDSVVREWTDGLR